MKSENAFRRMVLWVILFFLFTIAIAPFAYGAYGDHDGPYGENDGIHGGNCLKPQNYPPMDSKIKGWATSVIDYWRPEGLTHGTPEIVLGQPGGTFHVLSLGDGGWIIVTFDLTIANGPGPDLVVWENGFVSRTHGFDPGRLWAELMFVEVSSDGIHFARFPSVCLNPEGHVGGFGCIDPTYYHNVAGKHPNGNDGRDEGTPFDMDDLQDDPLVIDGTVDLSNIHYVKLIDVIGDGSTYDSLGNPMLDPFPTPFGTGGADLDAVAVLNVPLPNQAPTANAGRNQTVEEGDTVTLDGSNSSDPDDGIASYQWTQTAGYSVTLSDSTAAEATFTAPDVGPGGETLTFELTVTDHGGLKDTDSVTVNITCVNIPPTAYAGANLSVGEWEPVTLDGSGSFDPDDGIAFFEWVQTAGLSVTLSDPSAVQPTFTSPPYRPGRETLTFELTVTDHGGLKDTDSVTVSIVWDNIPPTADAGKDQTVEEGAIVILDGSGSSDLDNHITSYRWEQIAGPTVSISDPTAVQPIFTAPDVGSANATLIFELAVTDEEGAEMTDRVTVRVTWVNAAPTADAGTDQTVDEGDTVTLDGSNSSDPDDGIASYQWTQTAGYSVTLSDSTAAEATFTAPDVGQGGETLTFELSITDGAGLQSTDTVVIEVTDDINEAPDRPLLSSPADGEADVPLRPELRTEAFSDPDNGDNHAGTEWQISRKSDFSSSVVVIKSGFNLTSLTVPELVLEGEVTYYWRVRFYDESGAESEWSLSGFFTTIADTVDTDSNGVPDDQEVGETVDLDRDGIADREQGNIKSVNSVVGGVQVGVKTSQNVTIEALVSINPSDIADDASRPSEMPFGLVSFRLKVENEGDIAEVTVYFSEAAPFDTEWFKYDEIIGWYDYSGHAIFGVDRKSVALKIEDGGFGDADGVKNGVIVDPGGVGYDSPSSVPQNGEAAFEGVGGCFIATSAYASYMEPNVKILRDLRDIYLLQNRPGRLLVNAYYKYSPPIADFIAKHPILRVVVRIGLAPIVGICYILVHPRAAYWTILLLLPFCVFLTVRHRSCI